MAKRKDDKGNALKDGETFRKDGRYQYRFCDSHGQRRTIYAKTLVELRQKEQALQRDLNNGIDVSAGSVTLNELFSAYLRTKSNLKQTTRVFYERTWRSYVQDAIGKMRIDRIKQVHVLGFYADMQRAGYAKNTITLIHNLIYPALEIAVDSDMIRKNPAKGCGRKIGGTEKKREALTADEQSRFLDFVQNSDAYKIYYPVISFALNTGVRAGELFGIRRQDIDLKDRVAHIRQQLVCTDFVGAGHWEFHMQSLKTDSSRRDIPLTDTARKAVIAQRELALMTGHTESAVPVDGLTDFVFLNTYGRPWTDTAFNNLLNRITAEYNKQNGFQPLPHMSVHILRHSFCTRMIENRMEPKTLQKIMGHSSVSVTMDIYTHMSFDKIQQEMDEIQMKMCGTV